MTTIRSCVELCLFRFVYELITTGPAFQPRWQDYRTRKDRSLRTVSDAAHSYPRRGKYTGCVKVVDTFGSDTSITVPVEV